MLGVDRTQEAFAPFPFAMVSLISGKIKKDDEASQPPINPASRAANTKPCIFLSGFVSASDLLDKPPPMEAQG